MSSEVRQGDALALLRQLPAESVRCCVTSPPYWGLRDYGLPPSTWSDGWVGCLGLEPSPEMYTAHAVEVLDLVRRALTKDGTLWLNLGDCYATGVSNVGECPGGGDQGERWAGKTRATRDGSHAGKHTAMAARGPMTQPNRLPLEGLKPKDLVGIPWRVAFAAQAAGWWLRTDIVWAKLACMPESVLDRPTRSHEFVFLLSKSAKYFYDAEAIKEPGVYLGPNGAQKSPHAQGFGRRTPEQEQARRDKQRGHGRRHQGFNARWDAMSKEEQTAVMRNKRDVWAIGPQPFTEAHFAVMPEALAEPCILAGSAPGDLVLDPFNGSGTVGVVALRHGRRYLGLELNPAYCEMARRRIAGPLFAEQIQAAPAAQEA